MERLRWIVSGLLPLVACLATGGPSVGQDHHHDHHDRGTATHRQGFRLVDPQGHEVRDPRTTFRFIVPLGRNSGAFYTHENKPYYTPPPPPEARGQRVVQRPVALQFGALKHYHRLAERLERAASEFCLDLHYNYRHQPHFRETYAEAYELYQAAKSVHAHTDAGHLEPIRRSATRIDNLFHHVQEDVSDWQGQNRRQIGQYSMHGKVEELEALIHHLMFDLGVKPDHDREHGADERPPAREEPPPPDRTRQR